MMYNAVVGTCAQQGAAAGGGGGGGVASVSVATSASGNYDNAVEVILVNTQATSQGQNPQGASMFSGGILGGAQSTFGTATSPTRTTQTITTSAADYLSSWNAYGTGNGSVLIGGYIRSNNFTTANKEAWTVASTTVVSQSFSTGVVLSVQATAGNRLGLRDNTFSGTTFGLYQYPSHGGALSPLNGIRINHAVGRGASTLPQAGDSFTFRLQVEDQDLTTVYSAIHDVTINFT